MRAGYLVIQERNSSNSVINSYVWDSVSPGGIGGLLELTQGGAHYDYLYDGKGNVAALTDSGQNVVAAYRYDGFGVLKAKSGTLEQPYQFSTKRYYAALGMVKYEYRDYLPALGKWAERDPLGERGGLNLYGFAGNSPVNNIDPYGELFGAADEFYGDWLFNLKERHWNRNEINSNIPSNLPKSPREAYQHGWEEMSPEKSIYHQWSGKNTKWISKNGHCEAVYNTKGRLVTDPRDIGTYNYSNPNTDPIEHVINDVLPYWIWGNSYDDSTTLSQRIRGNR